MGETIQSHRVGAEDTFTLSAEDAAAFADIDLHYHQEEASQIESELIFNSEKRRQDDIITWLAEVLPGTMATEIEYSLHGEDLFTADGQKVGEIFDDAIKAAQYLPIELAFELRRRRIEKDEYKDMVRMARGELVDPRTGKKANTIVVTSDFPPELMHESEDVGGYSGKRKTTMNRVITLTKEGIKITTLSLDGSNRKALEGMYEHCGYKAQPGELLGQRMYLSLNVNEQEKLPYVLRGMYDTSLAEQFGGTWNGGRSEGDQRNTYDFIWENYDLISHYLSTTTSFTGGSAEYSLAAAMTQRFNNKEQQKRIHPSNFSAVQTAALQSELQSAAAIAMLNGETFSGCGASISGGNTEGAQGGLLAMGYGNLSVQDRYGPLKFVCQNGCENKREFGELIDECRKCGIDVSCKDKKEDEQKQAELFKKQSKKKPPTKKFFALAA